MNLTLNSIQQNRNTHKTKQQSAFGAISPEQLKDLKKGCVVVREQLGDTKGHWALSEQAIFLGLKKDLIDKSREAVSLICSKITGSTKRSPGGCFDDVSAKSELVKHKVPLEQFMQEYSLAKYGPFNRKIDMKP